MLAGMLRKKMRRYRVDCSSTSAGESIHSSMVREAKKPKVPTITPRTRLREKAVWMVSLTSV